jgi:hypothetical protein
MANRKVIPYQLLALLLYGQHEWIERSGPPGFFLVAPVRDVCTQLKIRPAQIQEALIWLEEEKMIKGHRWHSTYFSVISKVPTDMKKAGEAGYE